MNVTITGANGQVGRRLLQRLGREDCDRTALVRRSVDLEADRVLVDWLHAEEAARALARADGIVHLAGTLAPDGGDYKAANVAPTRRVVEALKQNRAGVVIYLSYVGASASASNAYLRAKGQSEQLLGAATDQVTVFRCTHIVGPPDAPGKTAAAMISAPGKPATLLGSGRQKVAPVYIDDVVEAIVQALERRRSGTFDLAGPRTWTMDDFARLLNGNPSLRIRHLPRWLAGLLAVVTPGLYRPLVAIMCRDSVADPAEAREVLGLEMTDLEDYWRTGP